MNKFSSCFVHLRVLMNWKDETAIEANLRNQTLVWADDVHLRWKGGVKDWVCSGKRGSSCFPRRTDPGNLDGPNPLTIPHFRSTRKRKASEGRRVSIHQGAWPGRGQGAVEREV